jgi:uncharacterized damage-inducible protein DinB
MHKAASGVLAVALAVAASGVAQAQEESKKPPTPHERVAGNWDAVHKKLAEMAEDFPEDKYTYRPNQDVRTFAENLLHIAQVNAALAQIAGGRKDDFFAIYTELEDDYKYASKGDTVAKLKKSLEDCRPAIEGEDSSRLIGLIEHAGEHYGQLVVYYRLNGMTPPASR